MTSDNTEQGNCWSAIIKILAFFFIIFIPLLLGFSVTKIGWFSNANGTTNGWLGFWGGYLGGIIGTLGVLYVAYLQNKQQLVSMKNIENNERIRLKTELQINKVSDYLSNLITFQKDLNSLEETFKELIIEMPKFLSNNQSQYRKIDNLFSEIENFKDNHFTHSMDNINILNTLLKTDNSLKLGEIDSKELLKNLDNDIHKYYQKILLIQGEDNFNYQREDMLDFKKMIISDEYTVKNEDIHDWIATERTNSFENLKSLMMRLG